MKRTALSRRTMLRGMLVGGGAVYVGLPILEAMLNSHGTAFAGGEPIPVRMFTWFFGNGVVKNSWIPGGLMNPLTGPNYPLSELLAPFANVREYVSVPTGFKNNCEMIISHHEGMTLFSGYTFDQTCMAGQDCQGFFSNAGGPSIDQVAASVIGGLTPVRSLQTGVSKRQSGADFGTTMHTLSHKSTLEPLPPLLNPKDVFYTLFGSFTPQDDPSKPTRIGVLNSVRGNMAALKKRLGQKDNERMEAHLDGISELETKINAIAPLCAVPAEPIETNTDVNGIEPLAAVNQVISDLIVYAFSCDVTRIASVLFHEGASDTVFPDTTGGHHGNSHGFGSDEQGNVTDYGGLEGLKLGVTFSMTQLAYLLEKLKNTPDGPDKNLLDNTAGLIGSDCAEGWSHDVQRDQAVLVAGGGGGRLVHPGIHYRSVDRNISDVSLTVLRAVVPEITSIGSGAPYSNTPVAELSAVPG
jgi:Protein of unknown function (DUF1552)